MTPNFDFSAIGLGPAASNAKQGRIADPACPGAVHAPVAADGALMRIRVPGGLISPDMLKSVAELAQEEAGGHLDVTARANLQLRGVDPARVEHVTAALEQAGFLPSRAHERLRNIVINPLSGLDPDERLDLRAAARALDAGLIADRRLAALPAKFGFVLDGGGFAFESGAADIAFAATAGGDLLHLTLSSRPTGRGVAPGIVAETALALARAILEVAAAAGLPARSRALRDRPEVIAAVLARVPGLVPCEPVALREPAPIPVGRLAGRSPTGKRPASKGLAGKEPAGKGQQVALIPVVALGRLTARQARGLAVAAGAFGGEVRLTPWRGVVLIVTAEQIPAAAVRLSALGLPLGGENGFGGLVACGDRAECRSALTDARQDAALLARELAKRGGKGVPPGWSVQISACPKRCAMRRAGPFDLTAQAGGYELSMRGRPVAHGLSTEAALAAAIDAAFASTEEV